VRGSYSPINVIHEIDQNDQRHDQYINLSNELLLDDELIFSELPPMHSFFMGGHDLLTQHIIIVDLLAVHVVSGKRLILDQRQL
jgi:hypothetical protein